jgi:hypothetical protein
VRQEHGTLQRGNPPQAHLFDRAVLKGPKETFHPDLVRRNDMDQIQPRALAARSNWVRGPSLELILHRDLAVGFVRPMTINLEGQRQSFGLDVFAGALRGKEDVVESLHLRGIG